MKDIAVIGTSNAVVKYGYAQFLKREMGSECDLFSLGGNSVIYGLFSLLINDIIDNYRYILLDFNINDTDAIAGKSLSHEFIVSAIITIINKCNNSNSCPLFLIMPNRMRMQLQSCSFIYRAIASLFNIPVIDIESDFIFIDNDSLGNDRAHPIEYYQKYIADRIIKEVSNKHKLSFCSDLIEDLDASLYNMENLDLNPIDNMGTSLYRGRCYRLPLTKSVNLGNRKFLTAIFYFLQDASPYLFITNSSIKLLKNLNISFYKNVYMCREIAYSLVTGVNYTALSLSSGGIAHQYEPTYGEQKRTPLRDDILIHNLLISSQSFTHYGQKLLYKFKNEFMTQIKYLNILSNMRDNWENNFIRNLRTLMSKNYNIMMDILQIRPDLVSQLDLINSEKGAHRLFWWYTNFGVKEYHDKFTQDDILENIHKSL